MPYTLVIAEKPSVAGDIARVIGCRTRGDGYYEKEGMRITWALGHLVALSDPEEIDPKWKRWSTATLPILPDAIPLKIIPSSRKQYTCVKKLMLDKDCSDLICATDAGREGELIFRYLVRMTGCAKPMRRLWISSMTDEAIREGFDTLKPSSAYDLLYQSARCRSEADWLVGMNASRAFTLRYNVLLSVGRVQTPTLALLVRRHHEIESFVPQNFWTVNADFDTYKGKWTGGTEVDTHIPNEAQAKEIVARVKGKTGIIEQVDRTEKTEQPPQLYDLTALQRDANRLLGFTAQKTLNIAQELYEKYKLLTYPRTDSRYLPHDMAGRTRTAMQNLPEPYAALAKPLLNAPLPTPSRIFDDAKVSDHHALLPTGKSFQPDKLPADARALLDLVIRRMLAAFYPPYRYRALRVFTRVGQDLFVSFGREELHRGWKAAEPAAPAKKRTADDEEQSLPALEKGESHTVRSCTSKAEKTKPPVPYTDASLLAAMEHADRTLEDESLREQLKKCGLGTPATRAAIIERLIHVGYAIRKGRSLLATEKGVRLISVVPQDIASPETTGRWEKALTDITTGAMEPDRFLEGIRRLSSFLVENAASSAAGVTFEAEERKSRSPHKKTSSSLGPCPLCGKGEVLENSRAFYCSRWKEGCALKYWKDCCVKFGGPELTAALMSRLLKEKNLHGSTGTLALDKDGISFEPKER